jgi:hypothetical protein
MVRAGGFFVDRFGMVHATPNFGAARPTHASRTQASPGRAASRRGVAKPSYQLTTGSLYWPAGNEVMLYSPLARYQTYGDGYGLGPYGAADHGIMYKGWSLEN